MSTLLEDIEREGTIPIEYYDPMLAQSIVKNVTLEDILQHLTGSRYISSTLKKEKIKVFFKESMPHCSSQIGPGFVSNTCEISIVFPVNNRFIDGEQFRGAFLEFMLNSPGFTKV